MPPERPITNRLKAWRAPLVGVLLAALACAIVWRVLDERLAAEAARQASRGASPAVIELRDDWVQAILPTALNESGPIAERARRVAAARIEGLLSNAERGSQEAFLADANRVLGAIRSLERVPTDDAIRWAEWVSRHLTAAAEHLDTPASLTLLTAVDDTMSELAGRSRRPAPRRSTPAAPRRVVIAVEPDPEPVAPISEAPWVQPLPEPEVGSPPPLAVASTEPAPKEPRAWTPPWQSVSRMPADEPTQANQPTPDAQPGPTTVAQLSDRELLAELLLVARELPKLVDGPSAAGPTSAPSTQADDPNTELRRRFASLQSELVARGFRSVAAEHVEVLLSEDPRERLRLVATLLTDRRGGSARLMMVLATDTDAAVRAEAISALGSSPSQQLIRYAWELALKDPAPEVGQLAEGLRTRLR